MISESKALPTIPPANCPLFPTFTSSIAVTFALLIQADIVPLEYPAIPATAALPFILPENISTPPNNAMGDFCMPCFAWVKSMHKSPMEVAKDLLSRMIDEDSAIATIIYGEGATKEEAEELAEYVSANYPIDVEVHYGGQPVYSYYLSVE